MRYIEYTVCFFSTGTKENGISQPPDMLNTSAIAHSKGLSMAFMLYFQPLVITVMLVRSSGRSAAACCVGSDKTDVSEVNLKKCCSVLC